MISPREGDTMKSNMPRAVRQALTEAIRSRYRASSGKAKRPILDEFIAATGYHCNPLVYSDRSEVEGWVDFAIKYCRGLRLPSASCGRCSLYRTIQSAVIRRTSPRVSNT